MIEESLTDVFSSILFKRHLTEPLYYSQDWLDLITKLYGYQLFSLNVTNSAGRITGFLPLCYIRSSLTGPHLVACHFRIIVRYLLRMTTVPTTFWIRLFGSLNRNAYGTWNCALVRMMS